MVQITGLQELNAKLEALIREAQAANDGSLDVIVGFAQSYALPVHERVNVHHPVGQAKFLEEPARTKRKQIARVIRTEFKRSHSLSKSLLKGGLYLQRQAQLLCPVDTSALKASAYTAVKEQAPDAAKVAFEMSEDLRRSKMASRRGRRRRGS